MTRHFYFIPDDTPEFDPEAPTLVSVEECGIDITAAFTVPESGGSES